MSIMIWSIASMYLYRMVLRDVVMPIGDSEIVIGPLYTRMQIFVENQAVILGILTYVTGLLFLVMYYSFAQGDTSNNKPKDKS